LRIVYVAVPPLGDVQVNAVASLLQDTTGVLLEPAPGRGPDGDPIRPPRRAAAYGAPGTTTPAAARLLDVSWMRNQRVARVAIEPAAYAPAARRLVVARRVDVDVRVQPMGALGPPAEAVDPFEEVYRSVLANYDQGRAWRRPQTRTLVAAARALGAGPAQVLDLLQPPDSSVFVGRTWAKIAIRKTGFYAVNFSRLRNLAAFDPTVNGIAYFDSLRVFTWPGRPVLPEDSYCDSCDYREVAYGIVRDVNAQFPDSSGDGRFSDNNDAIYFFAQGPDGWASDYDASLPDTSWVNHPYDSSNYYYIGVGRPNLGFGGSPARIAARDVTPTGAGTVVTAVPGRLHLEQDVEYWPDATAIGSTLAWEKFFWRSLSAGQSFRTSVDVPDADTTQTARVRVRDWGLTSNQLFPPDGVSCFYGNPGEFDHFLDVSFANITFPERTWDGFSSLEQGGQTWDTTGVQLHTTGNTLALSIPVQPGYGDCFGRIDQSGLAWYELYYPRRLLPQNDAIEFRTAAPAGTFHYDIGPFLGATPPFVFDVTDPLHPVRLTGAAWTPVAAGWSLAFEDTQSVSHRYSVVPDSLITQAVVPAAQVADAPLTSLTNLRALTNQADYLVVYYDGFKAAADSLTAWRATHLPASGRSKPYATLGVPISALYDQFSGGRTDPGAIRNFLRAAFYWQRPPVYVTLLGDASYDFRNLNGYAPPGQPACLLPTYENGFDPSFTVWKKFTTDDWLLNVNDARHILPDYFGGRIPADDAAGAVSVVHDKILAYERNVPFGEYRNTVMLVADDDRQSTHCDDIVWGHVQQTDALNINSTPLHMDRDYVYLATYPVGPANTRPGARDDIKRFLNDGVAMWNFVGHGSPFKITDESVFIDADAATLTNAGRLPLFVSASCDVGKFDNPVVQSLGEQLLMQSNVGCIGVISATELAFSGENAALNQLIYNELFRRDTLAVVDPFLGTPIYDEPGFGQYHEAVSTALAAAKYATATDTNSFTPNATKYQLMGDAGTVLNLPRLWAEITLYDSSGAPVTQVQRGQTVTFRGRVLDRPGGSLVPFDGTANVLIEDSAPTLQSGPDDCTSQFVLFRYRAGPIFHGVVSLASGLFEGRFIVPLEASLGPVARARAYLTGRAGSDAFDSDGAGSLALTVAPGTAPAGDVGGPRITLSFVGGALAVRPDAVLEINLFDPSGILTTGHSLLNAIVVTVDGNTTTRTDVTPSFRYAADSYQSGTATFQLPGLSPGPHTVSVSAADNLATGIGAAQHRSSASLDFQVVGTPPLHIARTYLLPNPTRSGGRGSGGTFVVDAPGDSVNTLIRVYTLSGRLIRTLRQFGGIGQIQIPWDGRDAEGSPLAMGTYLYKVFVDAREADGSGSDSQNAAAEGRIVIVGH
ncbi:MAG TPA: C25 family cysteine peptidase, partial [Candidatus Eisenbacteria bacterium]|nr:C25 family cysteine peptidase [Candidatus Eisenbacteria bacterium]